MAAEFDPYRKWLGIPPSEQPANHYRLLGIPLYESDVDVISNAADRQMAHVRTFQSGKYSKESQKILNELSAARVVLLDAKKREAYDAQLRAQLQPTPPQPQPPQGNVYPPAYGQPQPPVGTVPMPPMGTAQPLGTLPMPPAGPPQSPILGTSGPDTSPIRTTVARKKKKRNDSVMYIIGGGIALLLVLILAVSMNSGGGEKDAKSGTKTTTAQSGGAQDPVQTPESTAEDVGSQNTPDRDVKRSPGPFGVDLSISPEMETGTETVAKSDEESDAEGGSDETGAPGKKSRRRSNEGGGRRTSIAQTDDATEVDADEEEAATREEIATAGHTDSDPNGDVREVEVTEGSVAKTRRTRTRPGAAESGDSNGGKGATEAEAKPEVTVDQVVALGEGFSLRLPPKRDTLMTFYGAPDGVQDATLAGLQWIADHQMSNGAWCFNHAYAKPGKMRPGANRCENVGLAEANVPSATALSLMALMGNGYNPKDRQFRAEIASGVKFLISCARPVTDQVMNTPADRARAFAQEASLAEGDTAAFRSHAWGTLVICEYYAATKDKQCGTLAPALVAHIRSQQNNSGGWPNRERGLNVDNMMMSRTDANDSSVVATVWNLMALRSAKDAGIHVPTTVMDNAANYLREQMRTLSHRYEKRFDRMNATDTRLMESIMFGLTLLDMPVERERAQVACDRSLATRNPGEVRRGFICSLLMRDMRFNYCEAWNRDIITQYLKDQVPKGEEKGSWFYFAPDTANVDGGRLYCTAMTALALQSYYRYPALRSLMEEPYVLPSDGGTRREGGDSGDSKKSSESQKSADDAKSGEEEYLGESLFPGGL